jgi:hypothetical protein
MPEPYSFHRFVNSFIKLYYPTMIDLDYHEKERFILDNYQITEVSFGKSKCLCRNSIYYKYNLATTTNCNPATIIAGSDCARIFPDSESKLREAVEGFRTNPLACCIYCGHLRIHCGRNHNSNAKPEFCAMCGRRNLVSNTCIHKGCWVSVAKIIRKPRFRFGKYKGKAIKYVQSIDPDYITWIINCQTFDQDFRNLLITAINT